MYYDGGHVFIGDHPYTVGIHPVIRNGYSLGLYVDDGALSEGGKFGGHIDDISVDTGVAGRQITRPCIAPDANGV